MEAADKTTMSVSRDTIRLAHKLKHRMEAPSIDVTIRHALERALADA